MVFALPHNVTASIPPQVGIADTGVRLSNIRVFNVYKKWEAKMCSVRIKIKGWTCPIVPHFLTYRAIVDE